MELTKFFEESMVHARRLVELHDALNLDFHDKRTRSEWRDKLFRDSIVPWRKRQGVWRLLSKDNNVQILGTDSSKPFQEIIKDERLMLLQYSLVMTLAAIDKMLHQATTSKNFVELLKSGKFDNLIRNFPPSEAYGIAMDSRKRRGKGGARKVRPAVKMKEKISSKLYEMTFLGTLQLEEVCAAHGKNKIFTKYAAHIGRKGAEPLRKRWSSIYKKRNTLVHECNILRSKKSPKIMRFEVIHPEDVKKDIDFAENFGKFLAEQLN